MGAQRLRRHAKGLRDGACLRTDAGRRALAVADGDQWPRWRRWRGRRILRRHFGQRRRERAAVFDAAAGADQRRDERRRPRSRRADDPPACGSSREWRRESWSNDRWYKRKHRREHANPNRQKPICHSARGPIPHRRHEHMSLAAPVAPHGLAEDRALAVEVLAHLDAQIGSARSLLAVVLEQGKAIRARDVDTVVRLAGILGGEVGRRRRVEEGPSRLLPRSGERLGIAAEAVTLERLCTLMDEPLAARASSLSAELRGLLRELQREHSCNRALMQIELGFLDHLMGVLALDGVTGYDTHGSSTPITRARPNGNLHVLDLRA